MATSGHLKKVLMLVGGNSAGKTTVLKRIEAAHPGVGWAWWYVDLNIPFGIKSKQAQQFKIMMRKFAADGGDLALEGTRMHTQVFQCMVWSTVQHTLYVGLLLQTGEDLIAHLEQRCAKKGKRFNKDYWTIQKAEYEGTRRYRSSTQKFLADYPHLQDRVHLETFQVGRDYEGLADVEAWAAKVIAL